MVSLLSLAEVVQQFFSLCVITEALPPLLMGWALASGRSILESAGFGSVEHGGSLWQLLTEATLVVPLLSKPCHANPILLFLMHLHTHYRFIGFVCFLSCEITDFLTAFMLVQVWESQKDQGDTMMAQYPNMAKKIGSSRTKGSKV